MNLIPGFRTSVMTRTMWNTQADRDTWHGRMQAISAKWPEVERLLILEGYRGASLQPMRGVEYADALAWASSNGLKVRRVRSVKPWNGFSHRYEDYDGPDAYHVTAIAREEEMLAEPEAHLGYPPCCVAFFNRVFPAGLMDPIWQWAGECSGPILASPFANPLLRYMNIRFAPHIPCSPQCSSSVGISTAAAKLMGTELAAWTTELLSQPLSWDCYRGVAIVKTPFFSLVVGSNPTAERYVVNVNAG